MDVKGKKIEGQKGPENKGVPRTIILAMLLEVTMQGNPYFYCS